MRASVKGEWREGRKTVLVDWVHVCCAHGAEVERALVDCCDNVLNGLDLARALMAACMTHAPVENDRRTSGVLELCECGSDA